MEARWATPEGVELAGRVWRRIQAGDGLDGLGLARTDGRWDLRAIPAPQPSVGRSRSWFGQRFSTMDALTEINGVTLDGLDFASAQLQNLRFDNVTIANCTFDAANCEDWRLWRSTIVGSSFARACLRDAAMAGWHHRHPETHANVWRDVDFSHADLRRSAHYNELYERCDFRFATLDGVDFDGARHIGSRFAGTLHDVIFADAPSTGKRYLHNTMDAVDFSDAELIYVEFRGLGLLTAELPRKPDQVIYRPRRAVAQEVVKRLQRAGKDLTNLRVIAELDLQRAPIGDAIGVEHMSVLGDTPEERQLARQILMEAQSAISQAPEKGSI